MYQDSRSGYWLAEEYTIIVATWSSRHYTYQAPEALTTIPQPDNLINDRR